jgi:DNA-directed RNA polymerase subunit RPC12/RpoP
MSDTDIIKGLACPRCGGMVAVPEGQAVVVCPYCDMRSLVRGDRSVRRYQVPARISRDQALAALSGFFGKMSVARDARAKSRISEVFLVHLPFWTLWARALGWAFGQKRVGSGKNSRLEPREVRLASDMVWAGAACDVAEFGVTNVELTDQGVEPFDSEQLHASGMVFEPTGSIAEAEEAAQATFDETARGSANLDRLNQLFMRYVNRRFGLVYYPLWALRYSYRNRSFQVVVDGFTGRVLYGKAPGSTLFRAGALSLGMAVGAFLIVDVPVLFLRLIGNSDSNSSASCILPVAAILGGIAAMSFAYRSFRYGEQVEVSGFKPARGKAKSSGLSSSALTSIARSLEFLE